MLSSLKTGSLHVKLGLLVTKLFSLLCADHEGVTCSYFLLRPEKVVEALTRFFY
jgi:hypothetical protein